MLDAHLDDILCGELLQSSPPFYIEKSRPSQQDDGQPAGGRPAGEPSTSIVEHQIPSRLPLFLSLPLPGATDGVVAFAGGPITALDWHPDGVHLAVSSSRIAQPVHRLLSTYVGAGHIQIWRAAFSAEKSLSLVALVPHNGDTAWDLSWRPVDSVNTPNRLPVLAVALASGQLTIYAYHNSEVPFEQGHESVELRHAHALNDAVRTVQWNPSATRLASGTVRGCIEIWDVVDDPTSATAMPKFHLATRVRVHNFSVSKVVWLSDFKIMSSGHDGNVNVRDIRMPFEDLDYAEDGLAWNQSLVAVEPDVAIAGTDNGFLKLLKLTSRGELKKAQIKRKRIQTGSLRDMISTPVPPLVPGGPVKKTALFSGGAEGMLFLGHLPRPLYNYTSGTPPKLNCNAGRYMQIPLLQWTSSAQVSGVGDKKSASKNEDAITPIRNVPRDNESDASSASSPRGINPATSREKFVVASSDLYSIRQNPLVLRLVDTIWTKAMDRLVTRTAQKVRINVRSDVHLCSDAYDQRTVIPRIAFSECSRLLAVTNHSGFLTVMKITDAMLKYMRPDSCGIPRPAKRGPKKYTKKPVTKKDNSDNTPMKKRGRPRKYPQPEAVREARSVVEEIICNILDEPFDDSLIIKPRRGGAPVIVLKASKRSRRVRSIKMHLAVKESGLKRNMATRKRMRKLEIREEKKKLLGTKKRRRSAKNQENADAEEEAMRVPLRLPLKPEALKAVVAQRKAASIPRKRRKLDVEEKAEKKLEEQAEEEEKAEVGTPEEVGATLRLRAIDKSAMNR